MKRFLLLLFIPVVFFASCGKDEVTPFDPLAQAQADDAAIVAYLNDHPEINATKDGNGLYSQILEPGSGTHPNPKSTVTIDLDAKLLNGASVAYNIDADSELDDLIVGWQIGLSQIGAGGSVLLLVPSGLAYGPYRTDQAPANAVLVCKITLKAVNNSGK